MTSREEFEHPALSVLHEIGHASSLLRARTAMKITFKKWESPEPESEHVASAVVVHGETLNTADGPADWLDDRTLLVKLDGVKADGDYLLKLEMDGGELSNWLHQYIMNNPDKAAQLLAHAHGVLLIAGQQAGKNGSPPF